MSGLRRGRSDAFGGTLQTILVSIAQSMVQSAVAQRSVKKSFVLLVCAWFCFRGTAVVVRSRFVLVYQVCCFMLRFSGCDLVLFMPHRDTVFTRCLWLPGCKCHILYRGNSGVGSRQLELDICVLLCAVVHRVFCFQEGFLGGGGEEGG